MEPTTPTEVQVNENAGRPCKTCGLVKPESGFYIPGTKECKACVLIAKKLAYRSVDADRFVRLDKNRSLRAEGQKLCAKCDTVLPLTNFYVPSLKYCKRCSTVHPQSKYKPLKPRRNLVYIKDGVVSKEYKTIVSLSKAVNVERHTIHKYLNLGTEFRGYTFRKVAV
jgi:hypothetical protein